MFIDEMLRGGDLIVDFMTLTCRGATEGEQDCLSRTKQASSQIGSFSGILESKTQQTCRPF